MEKTYNLDELTGMLGVSVFTIRNYIKSGKLPAYKVGRSYRVKETDLERFLESEPTQKPDLVKALDLTFTDEEHEELFREWLKEGNQDNRELMSLVFVLTMNPTTRTHFNEVFDMENRMIKPECLKKAWQTGESKEVCRLAYNLYNGWTDPNNRHACSIPELLNQDTTVKMCALRILFSNN